MKICGFVSFYLINDVVILSLFSLDMCSGYWNNWMLAKNLQNVVWMFDEGCRTVLRVSHFVIIFYTKV